MEDSITTSTGVVPGTASFTTCLAYDDAAISVRPAGTDAVHVDFTTADRRIWANVTISTDQARDLLSQLSERVQ